MRQREGSEIRHGAVAVEAAARGGGVGKIWGAMKRSAELAAGQDGGARYVAKKLAEFCRARQPAGPSRVVLHACGHSAGSIFHSHFLPAVFDEGAPDLACLYLLAPAAILLLIAALVWLPGMVRSSRYRPGRGWGAAPLWFGGPPDPAAAVESASTGDLVRGGASGDW